MRHVYDISKAAALSVHDRAARWADAGPAWRGWAFEFVMFGIKAGWACLYGALMLALLIATALFWPDEGAPLHRYDLLFLAAVAIQVALIALKLERREEVVVIAVFHVVGTVMELFKTHVGSWTYPEEAVFRIGGVPLFTGFMYACVGSYMARVMRILDLRFTAHPPAWATAALALAAYVNFFTHHYVLDVRWGLFAASILLFARCRVHFRPHATWRWMPMLPGLVFTAFFIWIAENVGTAAGAWLYPSQTDGWHMVPLSKMGAWYLLMLLSWALVTLVHPPRPMREAAPAR